MWWDESIPRCTKFHQSRNSNGEVRRRLRCLCVCVWGGGMYTHVCMWTGPPKHLPRPTYLTKPHRQQQTPNKQLLCGEHSRATGARYGEQSRKAKGGNNKGKASGASSAAAKAKKSQRVVKRKVW